MAEEVIYRCVSEACGRLFPRRVAFCPYCGTRQEGAPGAAAAPAAVPEPAALPEAAAMPEPAAVPEPAAMAEPAAAPEPAAMPEPAAAPAAASSAAEAAPPEPRPKFDFGKKLPEPPVSRPSAPVGPRPVRKRSWLLALLVLGTVWMCAKPPDGAREIDARIDAAIAMTADCRIDEAGAELTALKRGKAKPAQWKRLQGAIAEKVPACEKKRLRARAWSDTAAAVDSALQAGAIDKAAGRLTLFARRWGEDAGTRELGDRIDRERGERLLDEAGDCLAESNGACLENRLLAAERLNRPELAQRIAALRKSLSRLLESTLLETDDGWPGAGPPRGR